jgi:hypothetical protein
VNPRRLLTAVLTVALLAAALIVPATGSAYVVGLADQSPALFGNSSWRALHPKRTRLITAYDSIFKDRTNLAKWLTAARAAHQEVVVAFNPPATMKCPNLKGAKGCTPVSTSRYASAFKAFHKKYPWVTIVQPWNEVNNLTQPTAHHPEALVGYYLTVKKYCPSCTVLGADLQDLPNFSSYTTQLLKDFKARNVRMPQLWGMHNYTDTNRFVPDATSTMRKAVKLLPGKIWLTETGGLFRFQPQGGRQTFRPDLTRQKKAMQAVFTQATRYRSKIDRVYFYNWFAPAPSNRFDAAVLDITGQPRPEYSILTRYKADFR